MSRRKGFEDLGPGASGHMTSNPFNMSVTERLAYLTNPAFVQAQSSQAENRGVPTYGAQNWASLSPALNPGHHNPGVPPNPYDQAQFGSVGGIINSAVVPNSRNDWANPNVRKPPRNGSPFGQPHDHTKRMRPEHREDHYRPSVESSMVQEHHGMYQERPESPGFQRAGERFHNDRPEVTQHRFEGPRIPFQEERFDQPGVWKTGASGFHSEMGPIQNRVPMNNGRPPFNPGFNDSYRPYNAGQQFERASPGFNAGRADRFERPPSPGFGSRSPGFNSGRMDTFDQPGFHGREMDTGPDRFNQSSEFTSGRFDDRMDRHGPNEGRIESPRFGRGPNRFQSPQSNRYGNPRMDRPISPGLERPPSPFYNHAMPRDPGYREFSRGPEIRGPRSSRFDSPRRPISPEFRENFRPAFNGDRPDSPRIIRPAPFLEEGRPLSPVFYQSRSRSPEYPPPRRLVRSRSPEFDPRYQNDRMASSPIMYPERVDRPYEFRGRSRSPRGRSKNHGSSVFDRLEGRPVSPGEGRHQEVRGNVFERLDLPPKPPFHRGNDRRAGFSRETNMVYHPQTRRGRKSRNRSRPGPRNSGTEPFSVQDLDEMESMVDDSFEDPEASTSQITPNRSHIPPQTNEDSFRPAPDVTSCAIATGSITPKFGSKKERPKKKAKNPSYGDLFHKSDGQYKNRSSDEIECTIYTEETFQKIGRKKANRLVQFVSSQINALNPANGPLPAFYDVDWKGGKFTFKAKNQSSLLWMSEQVKMLQQGSCSLPNGSKLSSKIKMFPEFESKTVKSDEVIPASNPEKNAPTQNKRIKVKTIRFGHLFHNLDTQPKNRNCDELECLIYTNEEYLAIGKSTAQELYNIISLQINTLDAEKGPLPQFFAPSWRMGKFTLFAPNQFSYQWLVDLVQKIATCEVKKRFSKLRVTYKSGGEFVGTKIVFGNLLHPSDGQNRDRSEDEVECLMYTNQSCTISLKRAKQFANFVSSKLNLLDPKDGPLPGFFDLTWKAGIFKLLAKNRASHLWLLQLLERVKRESGFCPKPLRVQNVKISSKFFDMKGSILIPSEDSPTPVIFDRIQTQNPLLSVDRWHSVFDKKTVAGTYIVLVVDEESYVALKKDSFRIFYGLEKLNIKFDNFQTGGKNKMKTTKKSRSFVSNKYK